MNLNVNKSGTWQPFLKPQARKLSKKRMELENFVEFTERNGLSSLITNGIDPRTELILKSKIVQEQIGYSKNWDQEIAIGAGFVIAGEFGFFNPVENAEGSIEVDWMMVS